MSITEFNVLGFDVSTSCTGVACVRVNADESIVPLFIAHITFENCNSFWEKADHFAAEINKLDVGNVVTYVEESLMSFTPGKSTAMTLSTLMKFNAVCSYILRSSGHFDVKHIGATSARKQCGIKIHRQVGTSLNAKKQVQAWALEGPLRDWKFDYTKKGNIKPYVADEIDAYVIARAGAVLELQAMKTQSTNT